ncbi:MAG TPA: hypothetical protein VGS02_18645 [Acidobacteriaceae bacterium]|nr:hypothetical protein [Acidobacteriaceae bacterium]
MHFSALTRIFWAAGFVCDALVLLVLCVRGRYRQFPVFTSYFAFDLLRTIVGFTAYMLNNRILYRDQYYLFLVIDYTFQVGIILEIAQVVLRPTGTWLRDARAMFVTIGLAGALIAAALSWWITPPVHGAWQLWPLRVNLFTSLLTCELFAAMGFTATRLGLGWRNHVMALAQGWTFYNVVMVVTTGLQSYLGTEHFLVLDHIRGAAYWSAVLFIVVQLWRPEPERRPIDPELRRYILALHDRVEYDLRRMDA